MLLQTPPRRFRDTSLEVSETRPAATDQAMLLCAFAADGSAVELVELMIDYYERIILD